MAKAPALSTLVPQLSDLELLLLICLIADNHCIVRAPTSELNDVQNDLVSISHNLFGFTCVTLDCNADTTLEDVINAVLDEADVEEKERQSSVATTSSSQFKSARSSSLRPNNTNTLDDRRTCNIIILRYLDRTKRNVQIQALELMRSRRIYSRTAVHATPKHFLLVALLDDAADGPPYLTPHLNDHFFTSHRTEGAGSDDESLNGPSSISSAAQRRSSTASSISADSTIHHRPPLQQFMSARSRARPSFTPVPPTYINLTPPITTTHLQHLTSIVSKVRPSAAITRHIHDYPSHLRLHRHVKGGVSAVATRQLNLLCRVLALLQCPAVLDPPVNDANSDTAAHAKSDHAGAAAGAINPDERAAKTPIITPALVTLAVKSIYSHRIQLVQRAEDERSMQWGSEVGAVEESLRGASVERVLEDVRGGVGVVV